MNKAHNKASYSSYTVPKNHLNLCKPLYPKYIEFTYMVLRKLS